MKIGEVLYCRRCPGNCPRKYGEGVIRCGGESCRNIRIGYGLTLNPAAMSNAERIRSMNDDELIKLLSRFASFACIFPEKDCEYDNCKDCVAKWLEEPAVEDE